MPKTHTRSSSQNLEYRPPTSTCLKFAQKTDIRKREQRSKYRVLVQKLSSPWENQANQYSKSACLSACQPRVSCYDNLYLVYLSQQLRFAPLHSTPTYHDGPCTIIIMVHPLGAFSLSYCILPAQLVNSQYIRPPPLASLHRSPLRSYRNNTFS